MARLTWWLTEVKAGNAAESPARQLQQQSNPWYPTAPTLARLSACWAAQLNQDPTRAPRCYRLISAVVMNV